MQLRLQGSWLATVLLLAACTATPQSLPDGRTTADVAATALGTALDAALPTTVPDSRWPDKPPDTAVATVPACDVTAVAAIFDAKVRPHLDNCAVCHSIEGLKPMGGGPPWYSPDSALAVTALLELGLIAPQPETSLLLRAMIPEAEGGIAHKGGKRFGKADPAYGDFMVFLAAAATCATNAP